jgi:hypothetical protein
MSLPWRVGIALLPLLPGATALSQDQCALNCSNQEAAMCAPGQMACMFDFSSCMARCEGKPEGGAGGLHYDPCYLQKNALVPCTAEDMKAVARAAAAQPKGVDRAVVGSWETRVTTPLGDQRWIWNIHSNGTYDFHAEGPAAAPAHSGNFAAQKGHYTLASTTTSWTDAGTYQLKDADTLAAKGRLGAGAWHRIRSTAGAKQQ